MLFINYWLWGGGGFTNLPVEKFRVFSSSIQIAFKMAVTWLLIWSLVYDEHRHNMTGDQKHGIAKFVEKLFVKYP